MKMKRGTQNNYGTLGYNEFSSFMWHQPHCGGQWCSQPLLRMGAGSTEEIYRQPTARPYHSTIN